MYLSLADNGIGSGDADVVALEDFRDAMMSCPTLTHIDLLYNRIGERGARVSEPAWIKCDVMSGKGGKGWEGGTGASGGGRIIGLFFQPQETAHGGGSRATPSYYVNALPVRPYTL